MAVETVHPLIRRLLAPNPSAFTGTGTQTHIVGRGAVAVIDPGPAIDSHRDAILAATRGERIVAIVCTHTHRDHSPGAAPLARATGAPVIGCAPLLVPEDNPIRGAFDQDYAPDRVLVDGERLEGEGWTLEAIATPGHASNHLAYALPEAQALFSGDHVMGWSTSVVVPPDGDMGAYVASLEKLLPRSETIYYPAHGDPISEPQRLVRRIIGHRRRREGAILTLLHGGPLTVPEMVTRMYAGIDQGLAAAAGATVLAHLLDLGTRGRVRAAAEDRWALAA